MKRIIKSVLSLVLIFSLVISTYSNFSMAASFDLHTSVTVTEVNGVRTAVTTDGISEYTTVYNTVENTMQMFVRDIATDTVTVGSLEIVDKEATLSNSLSMRSKIHQDTFCNYEYDIWTGNPYEWNLERPKESGSGQYYFKCYENSSNNSELDDWRDNVDNLNDLEWAAVSSYGLALVTSAAAGFISGMAVATAGVLSPAAITSIVAAVGATGAAAVALSKVGTACNGCLLAYWDVYYATDNMHF